MPKQSQVPIELCVKNRTSKYFHSHHIRHKPRMNNVLKYGMGTFNYIAQHCVNFATFFWLVKCRTN